MAKRLGGSLLGFGVKSAGEFCMSYECAARRGARERAISYINKYITLRQTSARGRRSRIFAQRLSREML
jgi:hypothetical protein